VLSVFPEIHAGSVVHAETDRDATSRY